MSSEIEILARLKDQMVTFLDELIEAFPKEPDFVIFRIFVNDRVPITDIAKYIVHKLCPYQEMIKNRCEDFFLERNVLFDQMGDKEKGKVNHFRKLWLSGNLDKQDKETIWKWFDSFIFLGNKYAECKKEILS